MGRVLAFGGLVCLVVAILYVVWFYTFQPNQPPALIRSAIAGAKQGQEERDAVQKFFEERYPPGTNANVIVKDLAEHGFEFGREGQNAPNTMVYRWVGFPCSGALFVTWRTVFGADGAIEKINAEINKPCL